MTETLQEFGRRLLATVKTFTPGQITAIVVAGIAAILALVLLTRFVSAPMTPLYSNLSATDAAAITQELDTMGVGYELSADGSQVMVSPEDVASTRLAMSAQGLPSNSDEGYALLDQQGITTSEFMQNVSYQRAMEGELDQTIEAIKGVNTAQVHLAIPQDSVFLRASDKPSASVMVSMAGSKTLSGEQVDAIVNLVASSVPGMEPDAVTVTDSNGSLLTGGGAAGAGSVERASRTREALQASAQAMLDQVLGPGRSTVNVNADLDFDERMEKTQSYTYPDEIPALTNNTTTETYTSTDQNTTTAPVVGEPQVAAGAGGNAEAQSDYEKTVTSETNPIDSVVTERVGAPGSIRRLTVSVLVDTSVPQATFAELEPLVANAVGIDVARGDTIQLAQVRFDTTAAEAAAAAAAEAQAAAADESLFDLARKVGIAVLVLAVFILALIGLRRQRRTMLDIQALEMMPPGDGDYFPNGPPRGPGSATLERLDEETDLEADALAKAIDLDPRAAMYAELRQLAAEEPRQVARVLRSWMVGS